MAILVDDLIDWGHEDWRRGEWCHLVSDTSFEELHEFAQRIGMRPDWFQGDHYDLRPSKRRLTVKAGAEEVSPTELVFRVCGPRGDRARANVDVDEIIAQARAEREPDQGSLF